MARTKQRPRQGGGSSSNFPRRACYASNLNEKRKPSAKKGYSLRSRKVEQGAPSSMRAKCRSPKEFPLFAKLPQEIRWRVWEMASEDGRIVVVHSVNGNGLRSSVPPILHACSESRAVGLKNYSLCFSALDYPPEPEYSETNDPDWEPEVFSAKVLIPARVYFNFDRDTLYFRDDWNEGVDGAWCCLYHIETIINKEDLQSVRAVGFDLNARICSSRSPTNHSPCFGQWTGLKTVYLGLEKPRLPSESQIQFRELHSNDYAEFLREHRRSPCWLMVSESFEDAAAMEYVRAETINYYRRNGPLPEPEGYCERLCPVRVVEL